MADIAAVTSALADLLSNVTGIRATDYVPDVVNPPAAFVHLQEMVEETLGFETIEVTFDLVVVVARGAAPRVGQRSLYGLYRPLTDAVNNHSNLGLGDGTTARVVRYRALSIEEIAAMQLYGGTFEILVSTPG